MDAAPAKVVRIERLRTTARVEALAAMLLAETGITAPPVPEGVALRIDGVTVTRLRTTPVEGLISASQPHRQGGDIMLAPTATVAEQRVALFCELKHLIGAIGKTPRCDGSCEAFARAVLLPASWLRADWDAGRRDRAKLAIRYEVPSWLVGERLHELGLSRLTPPNSAVTRIGCQQIVRRVEGRHA